ncbi:3-methyladenine DNA glycosylase [Allokutzneria sp. A3M-2-11 16]|uniref:3-methyladenine DNA glycosylase n=1 Tax=Allokutzneria sp. A3M-2-11 16 TaxID=2962043 RepID=UPI0020B82CC9|nr:3-methyladenine DNA glycosylase [Allokutzneria sp. A3M-2-11 16]MCP3802156.1 3-methyladenine DNA glycosylase [Allokutzneria sp. A3M-2-11 16]
MTVVLSEAEWRARRDAHLARVSPWTHGHRERRIRGEKHPVLDFLFTYYSFRPSRLERWHPGPDVVLEGADEYLEWAGYAATDDGVALDPLAFTEARRRTAEFMLALLTATASRPPRLGCFGLHEWAMVYRTSPEEVRHTGWSLRLGHDGTDSVVEGSRVACSHYDAFRFFTTPARPLNAMQPTRESQIALEQPGCLHANMDLFKHSYKLAPFTPSDLVASCFELAVDVRELDMRASPYDLAELGYPPVRIETPEGRAEYVKAQGVFAERAEPLRLRLIEVCKRLLRYPVGVAR